MPPRTSRRRSERLWRLHNGGSTALAKQWSNVENRMIRILESYDSTRYTYYDLSLVTTQGWRPLAAPWIVFICMLINPVVEFDEVIEEIQEYLHTISPYLAVEFIPPHLWTPVDKDEGDDNDEGSLW
ncbi:hypothetical protein EsDP_00006085 [Epichloe bromicola]|uniref:Uncharacterized protein n=1 Tax=Epichloe bromicola TaxID=79588 RepID=A0ABQ0CWJ6_9HYPO